MKYRRERIMQVMSLIEHLEVWACKIDDPVSKRGRDITLDRQAFDAQAFYRQAFHRQASTL
jgi:hypothetical protein